MRSLFALARFVYENGRETIVTVDHFSLTDQLCVPIGIRRWSASRLVVLSIVEEDKPDNEQRARDTNH